MNDVRLPIGPLEEALGHYWDRRQVPLEDREAVKAAAVFGVTARTWRNWVRTGLTWYTADAAAVHGLGVMPWMIWPEWEAIADHRAATWELKSKRAGTSVRVNA